MMTLQLLLKKRLETLGARDVEDPRSAMRMMSGKAIDERDAERQKIQSAIAMLDQKNFNESAFNKKFPRSYRHD